MFLLHVSDIHFRVPHCTNPAMDPDRKFRTAMISSVADQAAKFGSIHAILVTGDIAFKGSHEEYQAARTWLAELAKAAQCDPGEIYVVPGNHDVDREKIAKEPAIRNVHTAIRTASEDRKEATLREQFSNAATGRALFEAIASYNAFAADYGCEIYPPERLYWSADLALGDITLRINGLSSTLLSGAVRTTTQGETTQNDDRQTLYLSPLQTALDPVENMVHIVMSHHPPDWFIDQDEIEDAVAGRAVLQLFGHKHSQRVRCEKEKYLRLYAGAVNPDRQEKGWVPSYNLIQLDTVGEAVDRKLYIKAWLMEWQTNPDQFRPKLDGSSEFFHNVIPFPCPRAKRAAIAASVQAKASPSASEKVTATVKPTPVSAVVPKRDRNLFMRLWALPTSTKVTIVEALGLIEDGDKELHDHERYSRAILRSCAMGLFHKLEQEVAKWETQ